MRISDWSSDVCSSDLNSPPHVVPQPIIPPRDAAVPASCSISPKPLDGFWLLADATLASNGNSPADRPEKLLIVPIFWPVRFSAMLSLNSPSPYAPSVPSRCALPREPAFADCIARAISPPTTFGRSEEHSSELQSLMRISYAAFCLQIIIKR